MDIKPYVNISAIHRYCKINALENDMLLEKSLNDIEKNSENKKEIWSWLNSYFTDTNSASWFIYKISRSIEYLNYNNAKGWNKKDHQNMMANIYKDLIDSIEIQLDSDDFNEILIKNNGDVLIGFNVLEE